MTHSGGLLQLRAPGTSLVLDCSGDRLPRVLHWGDDLGDLESTGPDALGALAAASAVRPGPDGAARPARSPCCRSTRRAGTVRRG